MGSEQSDRRGRMLDGALTFFYQMPPPQGKTQPTYRLRYFCSNCNYRGTVEIPKGMPNHTKNCPSCGCYTYKKDSW